VFAERGYRGASIEEIVRRSGVTPPVFYDHFASKHELHRHLMEHYYGELQDVWYEHVAGGAPLTEWLPRAVDAWFAYLEGRPFASRLLFRDPSGDRQIEGVNRDVAARSRELMIALFAQEAEAGGVDLGDAVGLELGWEVVRAVLQGLALWWSEHPDVPRERVVTAAMNGLWVGFERVLQGESWDGSPSPHG